MRGRRLWALAPAFALLACASVMRAPVVVIPPLLGQISADFQLNPVQAGVLVGLPVLCFGVLTPIASVLLRLTGINHATIYCLLGVVAGSLVRSFGAQPGLYLGSLILGAGLAIGNLSIPMLIGRDFQRRTALLTGAYTSTVNIVVALVTAAAAPVAVVVGWRWSAAGSGVVLGLVALVAWVAVYPPGDPGARAGIRRRAGLSPVQPASPIAAGLERRQIGRWRVVWLFVAAFVCHILAYNVVTAWLPTALAEMRHMSVVGAGLGSSLFQAAGIAGPFLVPILMSALGWSQLRTMAAVCVCWITLPIGLIAVPGWWPVWSLVGGLAQGAFFTVLFVVVIQRARDVDENRRITALIQTIGYTVAATGPVAASWIHSRVPGWTMTFVAVFLVLVAMSVCALLAVADSSQPPEGKRTVSDRDD